MRFIVGNIPDPLFIEVIPLDSSIDSSGLTYFASDDLRGSFGVGSLIEIPLRNSISSAIVAKLDTEPPSTENIRSLVSVTCSIPLLSAYQMETILFLANRYFVHAHKALSLFLSKSLIRYLEKKSFIQLVTPWENIERAETKPRFVHCRENLNPYTVIHEFAHNKEKIVIVFPDDFSLDGYLHQFAEEDTETTLIIRDSITETQKYKRFIDVYNGEKKIIIWTRRLLYYNLSHYPEILYIEDSLCRQLLRFQHAYKNIEVLEQVTKTGAFQTTIISTIPSIESLYKGHTWKYSFSPSL